MSHKTLDRPAAQCGFGRNGEGLSMKKTVFVLILLVPANVFAAEEKRGLFIGYGF